MGAISAFREQQSLTAQAGALRKHLTSILHDSAVWLGVVSSVNEKAI